MAAWQIVFLTLVSIIILLDISVNYSLFTKARLILACYLVGKDSAIINCYFYHSVEVEGLANTGSFLVKNARTPQKCIFKQNGELIPPYNQINEDM